MATTFTTGTLSTPAAFSQREDLANFISNIVRDDVPFMSSIGKGKATAVNHEWSTDTLERPMANAAAEGSNFAENTVDLPEVQRLGNYTQIFTKTLTVSGTIEAVNKAGRKSEFKYQSEKRGKELMRDIEFALIGTRATKSGSGTRGLGGYQSWVPGTNSIGANVAAGTVVVGLGNGTNINSDTAVNAPFALSQVDEVMQAVWQNGGKPNTLMMSPKNKRQFSIAAQGQTTSNVGVNNVRRNIDEKGSLRQSVEMYESDFGLVKVVPNYIMAASKIGSGAAASHTDTDILVYDASSFKMATLRPLHHADIAESGDSLRAMMIHEATLECMDPDAVGIIYNLS